MCDRQFLIFRFLSTPSGWRATFFVMFVEPPLFVFLSTPSGWRATGIRLLKLVKVLFLSTPSGWRATGRLAPERWSFTISIHALRVEGDVQDGSGMVAQIVFLSTPSGWRATSRRLTRAAVLGNFYPRPPGGGRRIKGYTAAATTAFLSTPSGWRATLCAARAIIFAQQFLSTPSGWRATGRPLSLYERLTDFYPRPPGGGRQQKRTKFSSVFAQKGEEFASLRRGKRKICRWRFKKDKFWVLIWCEGSGKSVCALASHCG